MAFNDVRIVTSLLQIKSKVRKNQEHAFKKEGNILFLANEPVRHMFEREIASSCFNL